MKLSIQAKATIRWYIAIVLLLAFSFARNSSPGVLIALGIAVGLTFFSGLVWPRCPHCGARVVQFNKREWIPDLACWSCHRPYDEIETPAYAVAFTEAVDEAIKLRKKDPQAYERLLAEAEKQYEEAAEREFAMLNERADHDLTAARMLQSRLKLRLRGLARTRKYMEKARQTDPNYEVGLSNLRSAEQATNEQLERISAQVDHFTSLGSLR